MTWRRMKVPQIVLNFSPECRGFTKEVKDGNLRVLAGMESEGFHMSISHPTRYPTWDEIYDARYKFCPLNKNMVMFLPPQDEYVNIHNNTFHLWELKNE